MMSLLSVSTTSRAPRSTIPASQPFASRSTNGITAARILLQRIRGQATFPDFVPIHPELIIRESTCPPIPSAADEAGFEPSMPLESKPSSFARSRSASRLRADGSASCVGGALLPSLAARFHLSDSTSGLLFLLYFCGTSLGALLCRGTMRALMTIGFLPPSSCTCFAIAVAARARFSAPLFLLLGISVGVPMSAITHLARVAISPAAMRLPLTFLNFSWSIGALLLPHCCPHSGAFMTIAPHTSCLRSAVCTCAAMACGLVLRDEPSPRAASTVARSPVTALDLVSRSSLLTFLEVGIENTVAAWLAYLRAAHGWQRPRGLAAVSSSFYWAGFLASRGSRLCFCLRVPHTLFSISIALWIAVALWLLEFAPCLATRNRRHVSARRGSGSHLSRCSRAVFRAHAKHVRLSLDPFHCGFRRLCAPLAYGFVSRRRQAAFALADVDSRRDCCSWHSSCLASAASERTSPKRTRCLVYSAKSEGSHRGSLELQSNELRTQIVELF